MLAWYGKSSLWSQALRLPAKLPAKRTERSPREWLPSLLDYPGKLRLNRIKTGEGTAESYRWSQIDL
jgi:hypothetical protein